MRVIKKGKLPPKEKKMTCPECGCVFMYATLRHTFKPAGRLLGGMPNV